MVFTASKQGNSGMVLCNNILSPPQLSFLELNTIVRQEMMSWDIWITRNRRVVRINLYYLIKYNYSLMSLSLLKRHMWKKSAQCRKGRAKYTNHNFLVQFWLTLSFLYGSYTFIRQSAREFLLNQCWWY